jgi:hypothetical protein
LALVVAAALGGEFVFGKLGAYYRYEAYIWGATLTALLHLHREFLGRIFTPGATWAPQLAVIGGLAAASLSYFLTLATTPIASNNIYDQQYQMHRFVTEYYHAPVAVNDLGWVAFRNSQYVLDFAGLASKEALQARLTEPGSDWMRRLEQQHDVHLAMIYDDWFPQRPVEWVHVGTLKFTQKRVTAAGSEVSFYASDAASVAPLREALENFQRNGLPKGVSFLFDTRS